MKIQIPNLLLIATLFFWLGCDSIDDKKGRFLLKGKKKMEPYPLLNLSCADKADKNFQAISDYCYWAETELM